MTGRPCSFAKPMDDCIVHGGRHKGASLVAHVLIIPDSVWIAFLIKQHSLQIDGELGVGLCHVRDPVRVQCHAHQHIFMAADGMDAFKYVDATPDKKSPCFGRLSFCIAVCLKVNPARLRL